MSQLGAVEKTRLTLSTQGNHVSQTRFHVVGGTVLQAGTLASNCNTAYAATGARIQGSRGSADSGLGLD